MIRLSVTGPESSGKTSLAVKISAHYDAEMVPEYAREYLTNLDRPYTRSDLDHIARQQLENETNVPEGQLVVFDTDALVLRIWYLHKFSEVPDWVENAINRRRYDHHLLTRPDIPYIPDPLRENPEKGDYFFNIFKAELERRKMPFTLIEGNYKQRWLKAKKAIDTIIDGLRY